MFPETKHGGPIARIQVRRSMSRGAIQTVLDAVQRSFRLQRYGTDPFFFGATSHISLYFQNYLVYAWIHFQKILLIHEECVDATCIALIVLVSCRCFWLGLTRREVILAQFLGSTTMGPNSSPQLRRLKGTGCAM